MNILVVTGRLAANTVRASVKNEADILILEIDIAAFVTPALLSRSISRTDYDMILLPGLVSADFSGLERKLGIPIRLGPKHAIDLGFVISSSSDLDLSSTIPACELLIGRKFSSALDRVHELENNAVPAFNAKAVKIGGASRMKVMAEVVNADRMNVKELNDRIIYFIECGADIIDLGISLDARKADVRAAVKAAASVTDAPLSIDTVNPDLINASLDSGIDIVLSVNSGNIEEVKDNLSNSAAIPVIIPDDSGDLESLFNNMAAARNSGIVNIIADPVLGPPGHGLAESIHRYYEFRKRDTATPLFFGAGNVTELIDADSIGVNSILAGIGMEMRASILFTPEHSHKAHASVNELRTASNMMILAGDRRSAPKDLGVDMLAIKEKRRRVFCRMPESFVEAKGDKRWHLDPAGSFNIELAEDEIIDMTLHRGRVIARNGDSIIAGSTAKEILDTIIKIGQVSTIEHAAYLGRELMKAEIALRLGRSYSQDDQF